MHRNRSGEGAAQAGGRWAHRLAVACRQWAADDDPCGAAAHPRSTMNGHVGNRGRHPGRPAGGAVRRRRGAGLDVDRAARGVHDGDHRAGRHRAGSALRGAAPDLGLLYGAVVTGFGVAVMQPSMPPLVRAWLPDRIGFGTAVYTNGLLIGEILPVALTLPSCCRWSAAAGGSLSWSGASPVVVVAAIWLLAPRPRRGAAGRRRRGAGGRIGGAR